jgi:hypothetical protein
MTSDAQELAVFTKLQTLLCTHGLLRSMHACCSGVPTSAVAQRRPAQHPAAQHKTQQRLHGVKLKVEGLTVATLTLSEARLISHEPLREGIFFCMCRMGLLYTSSSCRESEKLRLAACRLKNGRPAASVMLKLSFLKAPSCSCMISTVCWGKQKRGSTTAAAQVWTVASSNS